MQANIELKVVVAFKIANLQKNKLKVGLHINQLTNLSHINKSMALSDAVHCLKTTLDLNNPVVAVRSDSCGSSVCFLLNSAARQQCMGVQH